VRITVVGTGYVGLVSGACFSEFGTNVVCVDKDEAKIARLANGLMPIYEPGLDVLVGRNVKAGRLSFTTDLAAAVPDADAVFIAVGTPSRRGDGHADLSYVFAAAAEIAAALSGYTVVVTKSTVPVGTGRDVADVITRTRPDLKLGRDFDVVSNPEFLREGSAIEDFMRPDRVVVGLREENSRARDVMRQIYQPLFLLQTPILFTGLQTAELVKYAANTFLATKITFINEMADLCERLGANVNDIAIGIGLDGRIGKHFLHAGPGYGGSCFPKDCLALVKTARDAGSPMTIIETVVAVNDHRKIDMARRIIDACGGAIDGKRIALLGLTFKPNTDDMRDSPSLSVVPLLLQAGAEVTAFDPEGMEEARKLMPTLHYADGPYEALDRADAAVLMTEWNQFRSLDWYEVRRRMRGRVFIDLRNVFKPEQVAEEGFAYTSIGRAAAPPVSATVLPFQATTGTESAAAAR
jgi:UDPglucose 6-dehydrogenase